MSARKQKQQQEVRFEWVAAGTLTDNPKNWKIHPPAQLRAVKRLIDDVGWAGVFLFNEQTGHLLDGHARKQLVSPDTAVPVLIGSWSIAEEKKILLALDTTGRLATAEASLLGELLSEIELVDELQPIADLLEPLSEIESPPEFEPAGEEAQGRLDKKNPVKCPSCGHEFAA